MDNAPITAKAISDRAQEIKDKTERRAYLDRACGNDAELRQRVEAMLFFSDESGCCLDQPPTTLDTNEGEPDRLLDPITLPGSPVEGVGSRIGPYKLLQQIGAGGMGVVFMAEQQEPVRRMVAVKIIKAGLDSAQLIARFEAERQALALMDHPNIARVLEADTTAAGRPYFVMELVNGIPITKYCVEQRLTLRQRLELFVPVCQAIQHAHQKGIIHRDIKPSNVLVASYDGKPVTKVIDFGVAKAMGRKLTERTLFTGFGSILGTLEYMSPEQAEFNAMDIDTRSDEYSLGVLLYELLTGTTPLPRERLKDAGLTEVLRLIREQEPPRPSTRLSTTVSARREMEPAASVKELRGEVDWIVMKALEKDRARRYETANGMARDIQRYLADEPVEAGPPGATYRLRKMAWKHRRGLATVALLLLFLVASAVVSSSLAVWASRAEKQARTAEQDALGERNHALAAEDDAKAVMGFFQDRVLAAGRPEGQEGGLGNKVTLRKAIDAAEPEIAKSFADRPLVEAAIRNTLGETYFYLGDYPQAIEQYERALAIRESKLGPDHESTLNSRDNLASAFRSAGRAADAIRLHEQNLKQYEAKLGPYHLETLSSRNNLAAAYLAAGRAADAIRLHEQNLTIRESALGPDDPLTLTSRNNLAAAYWSSGRIEAAIRLQEQNLKLRENKLGPDHPDTLISRNNLANSYQSAGQIDSAIRLHEQNLEQREAKLGPDHPHTLASRNNLAAAYLAAGRNADAIRLHEQTLKERESKLGPDHPETLVSRNNLAAAYMSAERTEEAIRLFEQTLKQREAKLGRDHPDTVTTRGNLAAAYERAGQLAKAETLYRDTLGQTRKRFGAEHLATAGQMAVLAHNLLRQHKYADAEPLLRDCLKVREAKQPDAWTTFNTRSALGEALLGQKKYSEAEPLLLAGYQGMQEREKTIPPQGRVRLNEALERLVRLCEATGKKDEAEKWRRELGEANKASAKNTPP